MNAEKPEAGGLSEADRQFLKQWDRGEQWLKDNPEALAEAHQETRLLDEAYDLDGLKDEPSYGDDSD